MDGRGEHRADASAVVRVHRQTIVRRLPLFALCWLGTTIAWDAVLLLEGRLGAGAATLLLAVRALLLGGVVAAARRDPAASWIVPLVLAMCIALGAVSTAEFALISGKADVLAFNHLTLYLASALCFVWGLAAAAVLLAATVVLWTLALPAMTVFFAPLELATAVVIGSALSLAVAEGAARTFQASARNRARRDQSRAELRASRDAYRDVAAREEAARKEAEAATRAKDEFLALCSHELRSPLATIRMWTNLLRSGRVPPEKTARALAAIEHATVLQARLVSDLLDVSSIASGKLRLACEPLDVVVPTRAALDAVRTLAEERGVRLEADVGTGRAEVWGDAARVQQIVWNLLSNAIKFTPEGGRVSLRVESDGEAVRIVVEDTGEGLDPAFVPHLFQRFTQADRSSKRRQGGLGLGLSIVRDLVAAHGGTVEARSAGRGRGSVFVVTLPRRGPQEETPPVQPAATAPAASLAGLDVLVVEDDRRACEAIAAVLEASGARVATAESAGAAREALRRRRVDLVLTDLAMPEEDGYQLVEGLRRHGISVPVAALTAFAGEDSRRRAQAIGIGAYLTKPVGAADLVATLARLAGTRPAA